MKFEILKNKRGAEKLFSIWWFLVLVIVGLGIVAGVFIFFSSEVDVREIEVDILNTKIADCIVEQGFLIESALDDNFDILSACRLSENVFSQGSNFFIKINFLDESGANIREPVLKGDFSFEKDCEVQEPADGEKVEAEKFPKCIQKKYYSLYYKDGQIKKAVLGILTASNQKGGKISVVQ